MFRYSERLVLAGSILRYKIKDIPSEGEVADLALPRALLAESLEGMDADLEATSGSARLELSRTGREVLVQGELRALVTLPCALCLQPARVPVHVPIRMLFTDEDAAPDSDDPLDDLDVGHYDGDMLDLAPTLREQLILGVPMSARCRESCRGLCATCGQDLNLADCGHPPPLGVESPLAALKNLKLE